jgi:hypothetical protein
MKLHLRSLTAARPALLAAAAGALLAGCASTRLDAQWTDPQAGAMAMRGGRVLVACEAYEPVVKRLCQEQMAARVRAAGAQPVLAPESPQSSPGRPVADDQLLATARANNARGLLSTTMTIAGSAAPSSGMSVGLGGFGGGRHVGGGIGVSLPIGGAQSQDAYSANSKLVDVGSGRMIWSAKATTPTSTDVAQQVSELARTVFESAQKAGLF